MKLTKSAVEAAFQTLINEPNSSVRKIASRFGVDESTLRYRLKATFGEDYIERSKGVPGSLLNLLRKDIMDTLNDAQRIEVEQWIKENIASLTVDQGLLTSAQENRLTYTECGKNHDLLEMLPNSIYLNNCLNNKYESVPVPFKESAAVTVNEPSPNSTSYVNLIDLESVLIDFYSNTLDNCDSILDRIYLPLNEWSPNSLWNQCDSILIASCLNELSSLDRAALGFKLAPLIPLEYELVLAHHYLYCSRTQFNEFVESNFFDALDRLAQILIKQL
ncbi:hypothetical protein LEP3755_34010 [Leptolyngbya sp. NIES-3755]|nr:hypothetical protein LEP3755_34010 [Leptolyngbya sp. NIES-3755]